MMIPLVPRRLRRLRLVLPAAAVAAVVLSSCGSGHGQSAHDETVRPVRVEVIAASSEPGRTTVAGELVARNRVEVASRMAGRVTRMDVVEGTRVAKGDLLARVDSPELTAALAEAHAAETVATTAHEVAVRQAERMERLAAREVVTPRDKELSDLARSEAEANLARARAARRMAEESLTYAELRAPRAGVVVRRTVRAGDLAVPGKPLLILEDDAPAEIRITLPSELDWDLKPGAAATVRLPYSDGAPVPATVHRVVPSAAAHTMEAFLRPDTAIDRPSGTFVQVDLVTGAPRETLRLPDGTVFTRGPLTGVFLIQEGRAVLRWVRLAGDGTVLSGVAAGDSVVVAPSSELADGDPVEVL